VGSWWALRPWAESHKTEVGAFADSVKEAMAYLNEDPVRAKRLVSEYAGLDPDLVKDMPLISWKSDIDRQIWQQVVDMLYEQGELQSRHDVADFLPS
jgi:ABC-type nitrate/sulfonate/bicarbonate transport system substrate-binding protein